MSAKSRDDFSDKQIQSILRENVAEVKRRWRDDFEGKPPHYICEECQFVSASRSDFEVDHVQPCHRGGIAIAINASVLCKGCNQAKKTRQFVPPGAGYAYRRHGQDRNPVHLYQGPPTTTRQQIAEHPEPFDSKRYHSE